MKRENFSEYLKRKFGHPTSLFQYLLKKLQTEKISWSGRTLNRLFTSEKTLKVAMFVIVIGIILVIGNLIINFILGATSILFNNNAVNVTVNGSTSNVQSLNGLMSLIIIMAVGLPIITTIWKHIGRMRF